MAKMFSPENDKWAVKISIDKKRSKSSVTVKTPKRQVVIRKQKLSKTINRNETWCDDIKNFICNSKKEVDSQARRLIDSAKLWQQKANEQFDMIQQYITREHNLQKSLVCDAESPIEQKTVQLESVCFPSMPVLVTEKDGEGDLQDFLAKPLTYPQKEIPKKIVKRRNTSCLSTTDTNTDVSVRKLSRVVHSSTLAISKSVEKRAPKSSNASTIQSAEDQATPISKDSEHNQQASKLIASDKQQAASTSVKKQTSSPAPAADDDDNIFKKFLETRRMVLAKQKEREQQKAARLKQQKDGQSL